MRGMGLDYDGIAGSEGRGCVSSGDGKGEREIAGAEDRSGADGPKNGADIGARERLAVWLRGIDARHGPRALFDYLRKEAELVDGSADLALEPRFGQGCFMVRALHQSAAMDSMPAAMWRRKLALSAPGSLL